MLTRRLFLTATAAGIAAPAVLRAQDETEAGPGPLRIEIAPGEEGAPVDPFAQFADDPLGPRIVNIMPGIAPNEIHLDPNRYRLYWTLPEGRAISYAVGVGRRGLYESGTFRVGAKREWPSWTPTPEMIERDPESYKQFEDGMPGGPDNPLGARALYLFQGNRDTYLRIHGTNKPNTIGTAVSNGCARLTNEYVVDLYNRVPMNARVFLYPRFI